MILFTFLLPFFMIPLIGLAIDGTTCYIAQAKLSAAVDGAALGAGRLLTTPANPTEIAGEFLAANYPDGYWGSKITQKSITKLDLIAAHQITVKAWATVPLKFLPVIGKKTAVVYAESVATRKDTRVELVLDKSASLNKGTPTVFSSMQSGAELFVSMLSPGTDQLGVIGFETSAIVAYPVTQPFDETVAASSTGGPDENFGNATTPSSGVAYQNIAAMRPEGGTNMSLALEMAYMEIQKSHLRQLSTQGVDDRLNSIVLFTDGVPTAYSARPNAVGATGRVFSGASTVISNSSGCTYKNATSGNAATQMRGSLVASGEPVNGWIGSTIGLYTLAALDTSHTLTYWLGHQSYNVAPNPTSAVSGCNGMGNTGYSVSGMSAIPIKDAYGTPTGGSNYTLSKIYDGSGTYVGTYYNGTGPNNDPTSPYQLGLVSWNLVDNIGKTIRTQTSMPAITIHVIAYSGTGGIDRILLKRLANTTDVTGYTASEKTGKYKECPTQPELVAAFYEVASAVLRLAK
jgi:Flp pilus assembly protein TadG